MNGNEWIFGILFVCLLVGGFLLVLCAFDTTDVESIKRRAIDNGHAIYHPDTGEFVFKGEIEKESSQ